MMRIAMIHFLAGVREGGSETLAKSLAYRLADAGHEVDIYTNYGGVRFKDTVNVIRLPYIPMPIRHLKYLSMMLTFSMFAAARIVTRKYDIVHGFFYVDSFLPFLAAKIRGAKSVYTFGGVLDKEWRTGAVADKSVALASASHGIYNDLGVKDIDIISNGVDTEIFQRNESVRRSLRKTLGIGNKLAVLAMSRPDVIKDPQLLHDVIAASPKNVIFILIGISEIEPLRGMEAKNVIKLGRLPNEEAKNYYSAADVFITTSKSEGMPGTLLEALSCGLPLIATKVGGIIDVINEKVGFFTDRNPKTAAKIIAKLEKNRTIVKRMSAECRKYAMKRFDWRVLAKRYEDLYNELLKK
ncbi:MAG: glycosyltransferase family 4 protein [Candidatus Aenigmarchaeota archaeon]|nr:glycosyltransferase family 4 protein [Candidatus Aenigmarchaeota archaeon]